MKPQNALSVAGTSALLLAASVSAEAAFQVSCDDHLFDCLHLPRAGYGNQLDATACRVHGFGAGSAVWKGHCYRVCRWAIVEPVTLTTVPFVLPRLHARIELSRSPLTSVHQRQGSIRRAIPGADPAISMDRLPSHQADPRRRRNLLLCRNLGSRGARSLPGTPGRHWSCFE